MVCEFRSEDPTADSSPGNPRFQSVQPSLFPQFFLVSSRSGSRSGFQTLPRTGSCLLLPENKNGHQGALLRAVLSGEEIGANLSEKRTDSSKKDRFLKRQEARLEHEKKLGRYFEVSSQLRYREKMLTIREKRLRPFPKEQKLLLLEEKAAGLESEKKRCEYEHTYIEKILIISPKPMTGDSLVVHTAGDILNNPDILRSSYAVKTTFRASDCWRYDTHYLSSSKNERAKRSELSLSEVDCWDASLKMRPEHVAKMGYVQGAQLFGLSADDMKKCGLKKKSKKV